jgi:hypothetical protein
MDHSLARMVVYVDILRSNNSVATNAVSDTPAICVIGAILTNIHHRTLWLCDHRYSYITIPIHHMMHSFDHSIVCHQLYEQTKVYFDYHQHACHTYMDRHILLLHAHTCVALRIVCLLIISLFIAETRVDV